MNNTIISTELQNNLLAILEIARFAPSVHNTQPWKVNLSEDKIITRIDKSHKLKDGDPTGRETYISLGIFVSSVQIAAESLGFQVIKMNLARGVVTLEMKTGSPKNSKLVALLKSRCSDRSIYSKATITRDMVDVLKSSGDSKKANIHVSTDSSDINNVALLTSKGIRVAMSSPSFRSELSEYLVVPWSSKKRGISVKSLYIPWIVAAWQPWSVRLGLGLDAESNLEKQRWESASGIIAITTKSDMPEDWFEAGRAYLDVSLALEKLGLSQATSAATVEASDYHEDVEKMFHTSERLQCMLRIGKGSEQRVYSPRVSPNELLAT